MPDNPGGFAADQPARPVEPFLVAPTFASDRNVYRAQLIPVACWRVDNIRFEFDSSFVKPEIARELALLAGIMKKHPGAPLSIFGHADPVGSDDYNKKLSGRRAIAIYATLTRRSDLWEKLYNDKDDHWGLKSVQTMLSTLGYDPGNTKGTPSATTTQAVRDFQEDIGLTKDGDPGPDTRSMLFPAYMDKACVDESGATFQLQPSDFLARGADPDGKGDYQGCSEFNPVLMFSEAENKKYSSPAKKLDRDAANAPNRRVVIFLFRKGSVVSPEKWPCPRATDGVEGCTKRFWSDYDLRRGFQKEHREYPVTHDTFACRFYDRIAWKSPCETVASAGLATMDFKIWNIRWQPEKGACGDKVKLLADTDLPDAEFVSIGLKARQGSSPNLTTYETKSAGGKIELEWEIRDVAFADGAKFLDAVDVEATVQAAKAGSSTSPPLKVEAFLNAAQETFDANRSWAGFTNHSQFKQTLAKFRNQIDASFDVLKGWSGYRVRMTSAGITGQAGGCPWDGYRWGRSTTSNAMRPDQYYDGSAWQPIPSTVPLTGSTYSAMGFYQSGSNFVSLEGGTWPEAFADYDFNSTANKGKRDKWIKDTHDRWTDRFHIRRKKCLSQSRTRCCIYEVEVTLTFNQVTTKGADTIILCPGNLRSNAKVWSMDDPRVSMAAHEAGHHMDNPDEYSDGAFDASVNGDGAVNGIDPNCIMGQNLTDPKKRHYRAFAEMVGRLVKKAYGRTYEYETLDK
jgi:hypothetical protein